jgi:xylulokinase
VAFALADGQEALLAAGTRIGDVTVIGGGARSELWGRILAAVLDRPLAYAADAEIGPAFGAARLGRLAATAENPAELCTPPPVERLIEPDPQLAAACHERHATFKRLYRALRETFAELA